MGERNRGYSTSGRLSTYNPNRVSMPNGLHYDDAYLMPASSGHRHSIAPTSYSTSTANGTPTTTRTYSVSQHPRSRSHTRELSRNRRSTLDSVSRPPVIVTTTQRDRPYPVSRNESPVREDYRSHDYYAQPASSIPSRNSSRQHNDEQSRYRPRERTGAPFNPREADTYPNSRPTVAYPSDPRHSHAAIDYGDDGYKYTNAGELVRYDLDHPASSHRRHDSFDRGYPNSRPGYLADPRHDPGRSSYLVAGGRKYEPRGGPPPSTRGFDKVNRKHESSRERNRDHDWNRDRDRDRDILPTAPVPPNPKLVSSQTTSDKREPKQSRLVSVNQEVVPWDDEHTRGDERDRKYRAREREQAHRHKDSRFYDESVGSRGFGIRSGPSAETSDRHIRHTDQWSDAPRRDEGDYRRNEDRDEFRRADSKGDATDRDHSRRRDDPERRVLERRDGYGRKDDPPIERPFESQYLQSGRRTDRGSQAASTASERHDDNRAASTDQGSSNFMAGLGITAAAAATAGMGLQSDTKAVERVQSQKAAASDPEPEVVTPSDTRDYLSDLRDGEKRRRHDNDTTVTGNHINEVDEARGGRHGAVSSDSDESRKSGRRQRPLKAFNPNDTSDLKQLKDEFAALEIPDQDEEPTVESALVKAESPREDDDGDLVDDDIHGREIVLPPSDRRVRVVSPPRDRRDDKPRKGILKQPKVSFPEEANPVREGVAPHKEDKKLKDVPPGARWTKINRKVVNPEALTIGKERFEVRDDFVIVLRVLDKGEIQAYAAATQVLRERRRNREDGPRDLEKRDQEQDGQDYADESRGRQYRHDGNDSSGDSLPVREEDDDVDSRRNSRRPGVEVEAESQGDRTRERDRHHHHHHQHSGYRSHRYRDEVGEDSETRDADL